MREAFVIQVDSRSTHNFLDFVIAKRAKLSVNYFSKVEVKIANGDIINTKGYCSKVTTKIQDQSFTPSIYLLSFGEGDMVLRVRWLERVGPIVWDFAKLTMEFCYKGSKVELRG